MKRLSLSRRAFCAGLGAAGAALATRQSFANTTPAGPVAVPDIVGTIERYTTRYEDTLLDLARKHGLGYVEMIAANPGIDPWVPGKGTEVVLPKAHILPAGPREGILLNVADMRLYYFAKNGPIQTYAIGAGQAAWSTPMGKTTIVRKARNPTWHVPKSIRKEDPTLPAVVPPGPDNPLGKHAMYLGWPAYLIHGTHKPLGVGRRVSHGCIRMYPEGIAALFPQIAMGTKVTVVNQVAKVGRRAGDLLLEVHPSLKQADQVEESGKFEHEDVPEIEHTITTAAGDRAGRIDWNAVHSAVAERTGMPVVVLQMERAASTEG